MYFGQPGYNIENINVTGGYVHAIVVKDMEELDEGEDLGLYIPKVMIGIDTLGDGPSESTESTDDSIFKNSSDYSLSPDSSVEECNYIKVPPMRFTNMKPPMFAKGETLYVIFVDGDIKKPRYRYENQNEIKRPVDHLEIYITAKEDGNCDIADTYKIVLSSRDNKLHLHTSEENGEATTYDIEINTKDGKLDIYDGEGNTIGMEKEGNHIYVKNADNSECIIKEKNITFNCDETWEVNCKTFKVNATDIETNADAGSKHTCMNYELTADAGYKTTTPTAKFAIDAQFECTAPLNKFGGIVGAPTFAQSPGGDGTPGAIMLGSAGLTAAESTMGTGTRMSFAMIALGACAAAAKISPAAVAAVLGVSGTIGGSNVKL